MMSSGLNRQTLLIALLALFCGGVLSSCNDSVDVVAVIPPRWGVIYQDRYEVVLGIVEACPNGTFDLLNVCEDIDGCESVDCGPGACVDIVAPGVGYICDCNAGYIDNGTCIDYDACFYEDNCGEGICEDNLPPTSNYTCHCFDGYFAFDGTCLDVDGCEHVDCGFGSCVDDAPPSLSYTCDCNTGYYDNEGVCENIDVCDSSDCGSFGSCVDDAPPSLDYTCSCESGYFDNEGYCDPVPCDDPPTDSAYVVGSGSSVYGSSRSVSCASGYTGTPGDLSCQASGEWTSLSGCSSLFVSDGLIGYWDAGNPDSYSGSGNTWYDLSGYDQHATLYGSPSSSTSGAAYINFNGAQYGEVEHTSTLAPSTGAITVIAWFYPIGEGCNNCNCVYNKESEYELSAGGGHITHAFRPDWRWDGYASYTSNQWYFTAVTYDGSNQKLYVNGGTTSYSSTLSGDLGQSYSNALRFAARGAPNSAGSYFEGRIGLIQIYDRALSADEVRTNFLAFNEKYEVYEYVTSGLIGYWDAGRTDSYPGSGNTWYDISGYDQHATLYNSPTYSSDNNGYLTFNGNNQYGEVAHTSTLAPDSRRITVIVWFYYNGGGSANANCVINKEHDYEISVGGNYVTHAFQPDWRWDGYYGVSSSQWYMTAVTWDGSTQRLYMNGDNQVYSRTLSGNIGVDSYALRFAARGAPNSASSLYNGRIGVVQIYDRALSTDELNINFNAMRGRYGI